MCARTIDEEACLEFYGSELDTDSEEESCGGDDYCLCVEAIGEEACAKYYG